MVETPGPHIISAQAGIAPETIDKRSLLSHHRSANGGLIRHFKTVGHVAGEADVENGRTDATAFDNIHHLGGEDSGLPGESRTGLEDDTQMRIALFQSLQQAGQMPGIIILAGHQVAAAQVEPLDLRKPRRELLFKMLQSALELKRR